MSWNTGRTGWNERGNQQAEAWEAEPMLPSIVPMIEEAKAILGLESYLAWRETVDPLNLRAELAQLLQALECTCVTDEQSCPACRAAAWKSYQIELEA